MFAFLQQLKQKNIACLPAVGFALESICQTSLSNYYQSSEILHFIKINQFDKGLPIKGVWIEVKLVPFPCVAMLYCGI